MNIDLNKNIKNEGDNLMKTNSSTFENKSFINKSKKTNEKGDIKMIITNLDFEKKEYYSPDGCPSIDDECNELVERILYSDSSYLCDSIWEVADNWVSIYDADLLETLKTYDMSEYIARAIEDFCLTPENNDGWRYIMKAIQAGECLYYEEQLYENIEKIVQNALIIYLKDVQIVSDINYNPDDIRNYIESYIENINVNTDEHLSSFVEDFKLALTEEFDIRIEYKKGSLLN